MSTFNQMLLFLLILAQYIFSRLLTVVVGRIFEGGARIISGSKIRQHVSPLARVHGSTPRHKQNSADHREDLIGRRLKSENNHLPRHAS